MVSVKESRKILIAPRLHGPGGVETHLLNLCPLLAAHGAQVTVVTRLAHPTTPLVQHQAELPFRLVTTPFAARVERYRWSTLWALAIWPYQLRAERFDVIYAFETTRFLRFLSRFLKPKGVIVANRVGVPVPPQERLHPGVVGLLDGFIVETELQAEAVRRAYGLSVPIAAVPHLGHVPVCSEREHENSGTLRVGFFGRYDVKKGVHRLLDLWPQLNLGAARLDFYGDGIERRAMESRVRSSGLTDVLIHQGWADGDDLGRLMARTDLVVLPSEEEGLPLVLIEAMAHGVPFVAFDVGAIGTLAEDNPDVRVAPLDNGAFGLALEDMAAAIRYGKVSAERLRHLYQRRFGYDVLARQWLGLLLDPDGAWRRGTVPEPIALEASTVR